MDPSQLSHEEKLGEAAHYAIADLATMLLPETIEIDPDLFASLGAKLNNEAQAMLESLKNDHAENLPYLMGISLKLAWFSVCIDIQWVKGFGQSEFSKPIPLVPNDYVKSKQWAWSLFHLLCDVKALPKDVLHSLVPPTRYVYFAWEDILTCMALYFFSGAARDIREGLIESAFDRVFEALDARSLRDLGVAGRESEEELSAYIGGGVKTAATHLARLGADAKNAENRAMKAQVFEWCGANMDRFTSIDSAAEAIAGKIVPVKFRTAHSYVTQWRKKIQPAGKQ